MTKTGVPAELNIDSTLPPEEFEDHLVQRLKGLNLQSDASTVEHHMTLDLWDFAGQHLYYASYPVFFIATSRLHVSVRSQQRIKGHCRALFQARNSKASSQ